MASQKRIAKEFADCKTKPPAGISVALADGSDLHKWHVTLTGPAGTPYAGALFGVVVSLPIEYPFRAPGVRFATRIYHPNVTFDEAGSVCLGMLKAENWKPASRLSAVLEAMRNLLVEPNPDDPLEARIADEFRTDRPTFDKNVRSNVQRYAKKQPTFDSAPAQEKK